MSTHWSHVAFRCKGPRIGRALSDAVRVILLPSQDGAEKLVLRRAPPYHLTCLLLHVMPIETQAATIPTQRDEWDS
jgi:hypothetical protein